MEATGGLLTYIVIHAFTDEATWLFKALQYEADKIYSNVSEC